MAIDFTVDKLLQKLSNDPKLKNFFVKADMKKLNSQMQAFLTMLFGGPSNYMGRDMLEAHRGLGIDDTHFNLVVKHLSDTLVNLALPQEIVAEVVEVCESLRDDVQILYSIVIARILSFFLKVHTKMKNRMFWVIFQFNISIKYFYATSILQAILGKG